MADRAGEKAIWIAWERHRRTMELADYLGIAPAIFDSSLPRVLKYPKLVWATFLAIRAARPRSLIVQNPSVVLAFLACLLKNRFKYRLIVDAHNAGVCPDQPLLRKAGLLYRYLHACADVTIVTNRALARIITGNGGVPLILPDRIPSVPPDAGGGGKRPFTVVYICTFSPDEPYAEFFAATTMLGDRDITVKVTGRVERHQGLAEKYPNIIFTGYLPDLEYWRVLKNADLIVDLTTREDCLLCGAYEAVAVGVPMVLTDTGALREYFRKGALYTANSAGEIAKNLLVAERNMELLKQGVLSLKSDLEKEWSLQGRKLLDLVMQKE